MSVLIKGMENPDSCYDCPLSNYGAEERCILLDSVIYENNFLRDDCPISYYKEKECRDYIPSEDGWMNESYNG